MGPVASLARACGRAPGGARGARGARGALGGAGALLGASAAACAAVNLAGFAATAASRSHKLTDLAGTGAFVASAWATQRALAPAAGGGLPMILTAAVSLWGARLASFLFYRVCAVGEDKRLHFLFPKDKSEPWCTGPSAFPLKLAGFWTLQTLWSWVCLLPVTAVHGLALSGATLPLSGLQMVGLGVFVLGFVVESTADFQKYNFRSDPANDGRWCDVGLWSISRHPNYLGEMAVWWGLWGTAMAGQAPLLALVTSVSPIFCTFLLLKVSGVPLLEAKNDRKYGDRPEYKAYKERAGLLLPKFPEKGFAEVKND